MDNRWIQKTLRDLAMERLQLERSNGAPQPTGPVAQPAGGMDQQARTLDLVENYQKYLRQSGRKRDPLMGDVQGYRQQAGPGGSVSGSGVGGAAHLLPGADGEPFRVNRNAGNAREGLSFQQFELPGGQRVNVYYGENGERTVVRLPKRRGAASGAAGPAKGVIR
jgi:hypothetical protein